VCGAPRRGGRRQRRRGGGAGAAVAAHRAAAAAVGGARAHVRTVPRRGRRGARARGLAASAPRSRPRRGQRLALLPPGAPRPPLRRHRPPGRCGGRAAGGGRVPSPPARDVRPRRRALRGAADRGSRPRHRRVQRGAALPPRPAPHTRGGGAGGRGRRPHRDPRLAVLSRGRARRGDGEGEEGGGAPAVRRARGRAHRAAVHRVPHRGSAGGSVQRAGVALAPPPRALPARLRVEAADRTAAPAAPALALRPLGGDGPMILLVNPRATRPKNRRFPLSVMAIGAALPDGVAWEIIDGNRPGVDPYEDAVHWIEARSGTADPVRVVAMTVMPGPQLVSAVPLARRLKQRYPRLPIVWGGYFPSLYPTPVLNAPYVDYAVRGQGEFTFRELLDVLDGKRDPRTVAGLAFRAEDGTPVINPERKWVGPDELPPPPYEKI